MPRKQEETGLGRKEELQKEPELPLCSLLSKHKAGYGAATSHASTSACTQHPAGPGRPLRRHRGLVQSRQVTMQQAGMACLEKSLSLCNAAVH